MKIDVMQSSIKPDTMPMVASIYFNCPGGRRKEFVEVAASGKSITNSASPGSFAINGNADVYGAGIASVATGTAGKLFSVVDFASNRTVADGDTLTVTYTLSGADS